MENFISIRNLNDYVDFLLQNNLQSDHYRDNVDIDDYISKLADNKKFCMLARKINNKYIDSSISDEDISKLSTLDKPSDKRYFFNNLRQINKFRPSSILYKEIKDIYTQHNILIDTENLLEIEKINDLHDIYEIINNLYLFKISRKEYDEKFDLTSEQYSKMNNDEIRKKITKLTRELYNEDKYYLFRLSKLNNEYLQENRLINIFYDLAVN